VAPKNVVKFHVQLLSRISNPKIFKFILIAATAHTYLIFGCVGSGEGLGCENLSCGVWEPGNLNTQEFGTPEMCEFWNLKILELRNLEFPKYKTCRQFPDK